MNRLKSPLRRALAIAAGATIGLAGIAALGAPAAATGNHKENFKLFVVTVTGEATCDAETGNWLVGWTVSQNKLEREELAKQDFQVKRDATVKEMSLSPDATTLDGFAKGAVIPTAGEGELTGTQVVPGDATEATLSVTAKWKFRVGGKVERTAVGSVTFDGECNKPTANPSATFASACDGSVVVTLVNGEGGTAPAKFTVTGAADFTESVTVQPAESTTVTVPAENASSIVVTEEGSEEPLAESAWTEPEDCVEPAEPEGIIESTCDQLIFTINNPEDGETITVDFVPNEGDTLTVTVGPGESGVAEFDAFEGLEVTPVVEGFEDESEAFAWELPEDCDTGGEGGGSLPVTGAAAGGLAAGAVALLAIGGVLFYLARRRRVTFTA
ncbi:cell wall anchor protein [Solwaraspora sp. WMMD792]|uniref:cell wall anchor protein n=1 Tax=Solwaraspora sp. WMMD792 TaxID=3016099 RepID=UPI00241813AA|nr:cell wall anchor protein [Solwaraspora sp. WMMD792]MDG4769675.1 cell wall anchor protein [Solwaraspora sp. WMMD792]